MTRLHRAILRGAALLVPGTQRAEWFAEWSAELWYVNRSPTRFCLGAFRDALWLKRNGLTPDARRTFGLQSPLRCLLLLSTLAVGSVFCAFRLPLPRDILLPSPYRDARSLAMISAVGHYEAQFPTVPIERYQLLAKRMQHRFTGVAFYRPIQTRVRTATRQPVNLSIGVASANLFQLLAIPISRAAPTSLILSDAAWRKYFDADPRIVGRVLEVAGQPVAVAAVIPASSWRLPGRIDAWLLQDQFQLAQLPPHTAGFVLGRLSAPSTGHWRLSLPDEQGSFDCSSLNQVPFFVAAPLMILIATLILAMITRLAIGEYPAHRHSRRWIFLAVKLALLLPIVCCGSLDLASLIGVAFQPHGLLLGSFFGLRWALIDQRNRCPVCLRLLTSPTRIGGPSKTFLAWYGTELICARGHGLLYVPEIPTSCYSTHRWQYLDPSWSGLFSARL